MKVQNFPVEHAFFICHARFRKQDSLFREDSMSYLM